MSATKLKLTDHGGAVFGAMFDVALEVSAEREETEREIKRLAESGFRDEAWALVVKHFQIDEAKNSRGNRRYPRSPAPMKGK